MTVMLELPPDVEARVAEEATQKGMPLSDYLLTVIRERQTPLRGTPEQLAKNRAALAMLEEWDREDETDNPEEITHRQAEWETFKAAMNENHTSNRVIYP